MVGGMQNETLVRLVFFVGILLLVALWEAVAARRPLTVSKLGRWGNNFGITVVDAVIVQYLFTIATVGVSLAAEKNGWGLLNYLGGSPVTAIVIGVLVLDMAIYFQHLMFHAVPLFWRLHMVHHADLDIDVTTGLRFHPIEIILSMGIKMVIVAALGPPVIAVLIFEVALNGTSMFNHGNIMIPKALDSLLRLFVVTPDMHRVHHSVIIRETNSNFGFNFPWWDRLFGTYRAQPVAGHEKMAIGLSQFRKTEDLTLPKLLILPFTGIPGRYSINYIGQDPEGIKTDKQRQ